MKTKAKQEKMTKAELAEMAAEAMNLLNDLKVFFGDDFSPSQVNSFHEVAAMLKGEVRGEFWNNGTLMARDLI